MNIIVPKFDTRLNRCMIIVRRTESFIDKKKSYVNDLGPSHFIMPELYSCLSNGVVLVCSRRLQLNQFSVPLSLSNMNNVHNTLFVANLIYNVVQHFFLSQLKKTMLSLSLAFNTSNALDYFNQP